MSYKCLICEKEFKTMDPIGRHLLKIHNMNIKEYYDKFYKKSGDGICKTCGKITKFDNLRKGYREFCSNKCASSSEIVKEKRNNTNIIKYGSANLMNVPEIVEKVKTNWKNKSEDDINKIKEKIIKTNINRYGCENVFQNDGIKEKIKESNLSKYGVENIFENHDYMVQKYKEKYGVENPGQLDWVKDKIKSTLKEKTGYDYVFANQEYLEKAKNTKRNNAIENIKNILNTNNSNCTYIDYNESLQYNNKIQLVYKLKCNICNHYFDATYQQVQYFNQYLCPICNNHNNSKSKQELEVIEYIKSITSCDVLHNIRTILSGKELDIYIPEKKLAFEFDGLYWHNELYVQPDFHLWKTEECEKQGIQLIHIFEDEWLYKQDIVKSRIKSLLGQNEKIYARKCQIKDVNYNDSVIFLNKNHLQGNCMSKYRYGLYYNNELVSLMTFGESRFKNDEFELLRFCNKLNTNVIGGASKLFKYFINNHDEIKEIISFADRRWSIGNLYNNLGFKFVLNTKPAYYYIVKNMRKNRLNFQKHKLVKEGYDKNKSEHEIMLDRKIYRIYDCGNMKFAWIKNSIKK